MGDRFKDIETISYNYNFVNKSIGDWIRIKEVISKYIKLSNGRTIFENEIKEYIKENNTKAEEFENKAETMKEFLDDFLKLTDEELKEEYSSINQPKEK